MAKAPAIRGATRRAFREQVAFFRHKLRNLIPTRRYDDMVAAEHDHGFMVAGAMKADLLSDLAAAVDRAITEGKSLDAFRKDFEAAVDRNDWRGWTGEDTKGGRAWRTRTIYRTNASVSYAAGRRAQLVAGGFKFWVYRHGGSEEPRPEHLALDGIALPPDHPFWDKFYPPSAWGCSCYVIGARTAAGVRRVGGDPDKQLPAGWEKPDPATGEPAGIDPGWGYAPGASVPDTVWAMARKAGGLEYEIGKAFLTSLPDALRDMLSQSYRSLPSVGDDARRFAQAVVEGRIDTDVRRTLGAVTSDDAAVLGKEFGRQFSGFDWSIPSDAVRHVRDHHGDPAAEAARGQRAVIAADFGLLPVIVGAPDTFTFGGKTALGEDSVELVKVIAGERYTAVFAILPGRRSLALKTFYVR